MFASGKAVAAAWVTARAAIGSTVGKDAKANYGKYATLAAVMDIIAPALAANKLALVQEAELNDSNVTVAATILHESGETIEFVPLTMPTAQRTAQAVGSAITYARRYQLVGIFGLAPDDDDGEAAQPHKPASKPQPAPEPPTEATEQGGEELDMRNVETLITPPILKQLNVLGSKLYAADWDDKRHTLVEHITKGATKSSKELTVSEAQLLIDGMERKLKAQPVAA